MPSQSPVTDIIHLNALYYHQTNQANCTLELLKATSRRDFIFIGSHLMRLAQTIQSFQNIYMGTKTNVRFKSSFSMDHCQKRITVTSFRNITHLP